MSWSDESADRHEIHALCARYAIALDEGDWKGLSAVFTENATMNFAHIGEVHGVVAIGQTCGQSLEHLDASQHLIGTVLPTVDGDAAHCTSYFQAQHVRAGQQGGDTLLVGGRYDDKLARTHMGWRITHRVQTVIWTSGNHRVVF